MLDDIIDAVKNTAATIGSAVSCCFTCFFCGQRDMEQHLFKKSAITRKHWEGTYVSFSSVVTFVVLLYFT